MLPIKQEATTQRLHARMPRLIQQIPAQFSRNWSARWSAVTKWSLAACCDERTKHDLAQPFINLLEVEQTDKEKKEFRKLADEIDSVFGRGVVVFDVQCEFGVRLDGYLDVLVLKEVF